MGPYAADLAGFKKDLQAFLQESRMDRWRDLYVEDVAAEMAETGAMIGELYDGGFGRYGFPSRAGGLGGDVRHCAVGEDFSRCPVVVRLGHGLFLQVSSSCGSASIARAIAATQVAASSLASPFSNQRLMGSVLRSVCRPARA